MLLQSAVLALKTLTFCHVLQRNLFRWTVKFYIPKTSSNSLWTFACTSGCAPIRCIVKLIAAAVVSWPWNKPIKLHFRPVHNKMVDKILQRLIINFFWIIPMVHSFQFLIIYLWPVNNTLRNEKDSQGKKQYPFCCCSSLNICKFLFMTCAIQRGINW